MKSSHPIFDKIDTYEEHQLNQWLESVSKLVGMIIIESTSLEDELELILHAWLQNDSNKMDLPILLERMNFFKKIESTVKIAERKLAQIPDSIKMEGEISLIDEMKELNKLLDISRIFRNKVAHGSWLRPDKKEGVKTNVKRKDGKFDIVYHKFDPDELQDILNKITWARSFLHHFKTRLAKIDNNDI